MSITRAAALAAAQAAPPWLPATVHHLEGADVYLETGGDPVKARLLFGVAVSAGQAVATIPGSPPLILGRLA